MKKIILGPLLWIGIVVGVNSQQILNLSECQQKARKNYPLIKQYDLIDQSNKLSIENANTAYLPQLSVNGKATYQSEVTHLDINLPNMHIHPPAKDQYILSGEVNQIIWDGGVIGAQKDVLKAEHEAATQKIEVALYEVRARVNQLYFGVLLADEQKAQLALLKDNLQTNLKFLSTLEKNGMATTGDKAQIEVEVLKVDQQLSSLQLTRENYMNMLGAFMNEKIDPNTSFTLPAEKAILKSTLISRPELSLYSAQNFLLETQKEVIRNSNLPRIGAFVQGGYGRPGLNMLSNDFQPFYIAGVRLSWNISGFYTQKNNLRKADIDQQNIQVQKEIFMFNTQLKSSQQESRVKDLQTQLQSDDKIIDLRTKIREQAESKLKNGTLTVTDLVKYINDESQAHLQKSFHRIQLLSAIEELKYTTGDNSF